MLRRLDDVIVQPRLHRLDRGLLRARRREHYHRAVRETPLDGAQRHQAVAPLKLEIGDDKVESPRLKRAVELLPGAGLRDLDAGELVFELSRDDLQVIRVVVDKQDVELVVGHNCFLFPNFQLGRKSHIVC